VRETVDFLQNFAAFCSFLQLFAGFCSFLLKIFDFFVCRCNATVT